MAQRRLARLAGALVVAVAVLVLAVGAADTHRHAHARLRAKALHQKWAAVTDPANSRQTWTASADSDGEMHWLRSYYYAMKAGAAGAAWTMGDPAELVLLIGDTSTTVKVRSLGGGKPQQVHGLWVDPQTEPLLSWTEFNAWRAGAAPPWHAWILAHAAQLSTLDGSYHLTSAVASDPAFTGCNAQLLAGLVKYSIDHALIPGGAPTEKDHALAALHALGGKTTCDLDATLANIKKWAGVMTAHPTHWPAIAAHAHELNQLTPTLNAADVWGLRGWLYATERSAGHRLIGACGFAQTAKGPDLNGHKWETDMLRTKDSGNNVHYGLAEDTIGHVRPQAMGGNRDPINFVPQSRLGQVLVAPAETLAWELVKYCTSAPVRVRYTVMYTYAGASTADRRPTRTQTVVDLLDNDCTSQHLGPDTLKVGTVFSETYASY